ncbi:hypothetical protein ACQ4PT_007999 [Festuca glaucescens]
MSGWGGDGGAQIGEAAKRPLAGGGDEVGKRTGDAAKRRRGASIASSELDNTTTPQVAAKERLEEPSTVESRLSRSPSKCLSDMPGVGEVAPGVAETWEGVGEAISDEGGRRLPARGGSSLDLGDMFLPYRTNDWKELEGLQTGHRGAWKASIDNLKPKVEMTFEGLEAVEKFYKYYAHKSGFRVRVGQQKELDKEVVRTKRYMCNREGFRSKKAKEVVDPSKKRRKNTATRCGCDAHVFVKLCGSDTYKIESLVEHHNHGLVSPDKRHLIRSNCQVNERENNALYTCHKASIGTCQACSSKSARVGLTVLDAQRETFKTTTVI